MDLAVADIDGMNFGRASAQQNVAKPTSRGPDIQTNLIASAPGKPFKSCGELDPAARHIRIGGLGGKLRAAGNAMRCLGHRGAIHSHKTGLDRLLRFSAALEQTLLDKRKIDTLMFRHGFRLLAIQAAVELGQGRPSALQKRLI
jgi:hypothetical protein